MADQMKAASSICRAATPVLHKSDELPLHDTPGGGRGDTDTETDTNIDPARDTDTDRDIDTGPVNDSYTDTDINN